MKKLAATVNESKDNFLVLDFFHTCSHCNEFIPKGDEWACDDCNQRYEARWVEHTFKRGASKLTAEMLANQAALDKQLAKAQRVINAQRNGTPLQPPQPRQHPSPKVPDPSSSTATVVGSSSSTAVGQPDCAEAAPQTVSTAAEGSAEASTAIVVAGAAPAPRSSPTTVPSPKAKAPKSGKKHKRDKEKDREPKLKPFYLCGKCHAAHSALPEKDQHPAGKPVIHVLTKRLITSRLGVRNTKDVDAQLSSPYFNEREDLLLHSQNKSYQFDQIRRAKHSTMMFLYHIFNPPSNRLCDACKKQLEGAWYGCKQCPEFDLCEECYRKGSFTHDSTHGLERREPSANPFINLKQQQRRRRQLNKQSELLVHIMSCKLPHCKYGHQCKQMRSIWFDHVKTCKISRTPGKKCPRCSYVRGVLAYHVRHCRAKDCPIPQCRFDRKSRAANTLSIRAKQQAQRAQGAPAAPAPAEKGGAPRVGNGTNGSGQAHKENRNAAAPVTSGSGKGGAQVRPT